MNCSLYLNFADMVYILTTFNGCYGTFVYFGGAFGHLRALMGAIGVRAVQCCPCGCGLDQMTQQIGSI